MAVDINFDSFCDVDNFYFLMSNRNVSNFAAKTCNDILKARCKVKNSTCSNRPGS